MTKLLELAINDLKAAFTNVFKDLKENVLIMIQQMEDLGREIKIIKKNQMENIVLRSTKLIMENLLIDTTCKLETSEERISELEDGSKYIILPDRE